MEKRSPPDLAQHGPSSMTDSLRRLLRLSAAFFHRAVYRQILLEEAINLGAKVEFGSHVVDVDCDNSSASGRSDRHWERGDWCRW